MIAGVGGPLVEVHDRAVAEARRRAQASASGTRPRRRKRDPAEPGAEQPAGAPGDHLPRRPRALAEEQVRDERGDRTDHEPGRAAEHVPGDHDDVGRRLDVGQRREGDTPEGRQRGQRRDEGEHARCRDACARTRRSRRRARRRGSAASRRDSSHVTPPGRIALWPIAPSETSPEGEASPINAAPSSAVSAPPAPPSTRATCVAKYQPPASTLRGRRVGDGAPVAEEDHARGEGRGKLGVVRRDHHDARRDRAAGPRARHGGPAPCPGWARRAAARRGRAQDQLERGALALAARDVPRVAARRTRSRAGARRSCRGADGHPGAG